MSKRPHCLRGSRQSPTLPIGGSGDVGASPGKNATRGSRLVRPPTWERQTVIQRLQGRKQYLMGRQKRKSVRSRDERKAENPMLRRRRVRLHPRNRQVHVIPTLPDSLKLSGHSYN